MRVTLITGPDAGHALPIIAQAVELRRRGHEVLVGTGTQWQRDLDEVGLPFVELPLLAPTPQDADVGYRLWRRAGEMAVPLADLLRPFAPDLVITDTLTRAGAFAAELVGVPWVESSPHFLYDPDPLVPPVGLGAAPPRGPLARWNQAHIRRRQQASVDDAAALAAEVRAELGLTGHGQPIGRLLATLPCLEPPRRRWPDDTFIVGALPWEPPSWPRLQPPSGDGPLVLVSDSTASEAPRTIAEAAVTWLRRDPAVRAVITTGADVVDVDPARVRIGRSAHQPLLAEADVVVGTAGHGLVTKALTAGVPLVLVPLQGDQRETAARVERAGLGRTVAPGELTPRRLRRAAHAVLNDPTFAERARAVADDATRLGPGRAAAVVEGLVASVR